MASSKLHSGFSRSYWWYFSKITKSDFPHTIHVDFEIETSSIQILLECTNNIAHI